MAASPAQGIRRIESWLRFRVQETTVPVLQGALALRKRYGLSLLDYPHKSRFP